MLVTVMIGDDNGWDSFGCGGSLQLVAVVEALVVIVVEVVVV